LAAVSIFLVGGVPNSVQAATVYEPFIDELEQRSAARHRVPRLAVVLFDHEGSGARNLPTYVDPIQRRISCLITPVYFRPDETVAESVFDDVDAIVVGGGPTPAYLEALRGAAAVIARTVAAGAPYLGFSAGAMIAPASALIGGYRVNGREVCSEGCSEGLSELTVRPGLGLIPFAVDVHTAQAGTLSRAVSAVEHNFVDAVAAIDEDTALAVDHADHGTTKVVGTGNCWMISKAAGTTMVSLRAAD
jgi:cyanophycinase